MKECEHFQKKGYFRSFKAALRGLIIILKTQINARLILIIAFFVIGTGIFLGISQLEMLIVLLTIGLVFIAEIFNTMVEETINLITEEYHTKVKLLKDMAAAAVWVACMISLVVGYFVFLRRFFS
ncbi:MAG: diacylglycerol kinase family protein [Candidatus Omnitrophota bacterium]|nr:diacylglycerol kinase family protein [Candidatus Omnitrophota bacterium]